MRQNLKKNKIAIIGICIALAFGAGGALDSTDASLDSKRILGESSDSSDIWQWQNCDCEFKIALDLNALNNEQKSLMRCAVRHKW